MISNQEITSMISQTAKVRFEYTVKRIVDFENVWVIEDEKGLMLLNDNNGNLIFPIWPFEEFAKIFCVGDYSTCTVSSIEIHEFLEDYIPKFELSNYKLSVFPLNTGKGMVVEIPDFLLAVQSELDKVE